MEKTPLEWFRIVAKEFSSTSDEEVSGYLEMASLTIGKCAYGKKYGLAMALMAAHLQKSFGLDADTSGRGPVTSETVGPLSASYATMNSNSELSQVLSQTGYGKQLIALKRTILTTPLVV